jgi:transposase
MRALFELEAQWRPLPPAQRHARRQLVSRRLVDDFFAWAAKQYARVKDTRGLVATAFGYAVRQEAALRRFLDDGRLPMTNNHSERAVRPIAVDVSLRTPSSSTWNDESTVVARIATRAARARATAA